MIEILNNAVVRVVAPEDIVPGDYVIAMTDIFEIFRGPCDDSGPVAVRRVELTASDTPQIVRVVSVYLPFVTVRDALGDHSILDTRRARLARVPREHARFVRRAIRADKRREQRRNS